jgi:predicted glycosyltransferase
MNILIDIGHPAHVHLFRNLFRELMDRGHEVTVTVKDLPPATTLLDSYGIPYMTIGSRAQSLAGKGVSQLFFAARLASLAYRRGIDLALGSSLTIAHASRISPMRSVVFDDDDDEVQPLMTRYGHPFAHTLVSPSALRGHRRKKSTIFYDGYHELAYLHPSRFSPDKAVAAKAGLEAGEKYFIMRFNAFRAHHDTGVHGLTTEQKVMLADYLSGHGRVFITTEYEPEPALAGYRLSVPPHMIHSLMAGATLLVGDSQTMTSEAAVLGVPSLRCNSFAGRISYLTEQEEVYGLTYAFTPGDFGSLFAKLRELLAMPGLREEWQRRRSKMLADKIDVTAFMLWLVENYPASVAAMHEDPRLQYRFRSC